MRHVEMSLHLTLSLRFPIDELNRLALDRVKSISALSTHSAVKGLTCPTFVVRNFETGAVNETINSPHPY